MASYLVLTSPGAPKSDDKARFIADRFSWIAFVFPAFWLLFQRQWVAGIAVALLQGFIAFATPEPSAAGFLIELALRLLIALEGPAFVASRLQARGWTMQAIITADDLVTAEMIYDHEAAETTSVAAETAWQPPVLPVAVAKPADGRAAVGLFENYGER
ncbi:DUF2628 domain-containing protein [Rhizobium sp. Root483D2]|uniref:DUF2628 domain-containing protein n=1 Tax=Rhizobium sp. Root483D2 TaxID=1736545 RepID=UPI000715C064|nr:DUF2628 domain-containing protein [Rhizobium sp. Root483D2]KQY23852.1 hypothetical protein ASD32_26945 [Rhizobium sp. Root483D2]